MLFEKKKYQIYKKGNGMELYKYDLSRKLTLVNTISGESFELIDEEGNLTHFSKDDIDIYRVIKLENTENARMLRALYNFHVDDYLNGVCLLSWTLYPDGRFFEDEDGFGGENNNETTVYAFMDTHGKVVIPFRDMNKEQIDILRKHAEKMI